VSSDSKSTFTKPRRAVSSYGNGPYEASRVDAFLDATLVFAVAAQAYLLELREGTAFAETHSRARDALKTYLGGISRALLPDRRFLVGEGVTLADICFVAELALFSNERLQRSLLEPRGLAPILDDVRSDAAYARAFAHLDRFRRHPAFAPDVGPYLAKIDAQASRGADVS
jgi:glutathione S-transferase